MENSSETGKHRIVEAKRIVGLLTRLYKEQVPLTLKHQGDIQEWYASITEIEYEAGKLLFTPIDNLGQTQSPLANGQYHVHGKLAGVTVQFDTDMASPVNPIGFEGYIGHYPKAIFYHQRREAERVGAWVDQKIPVMLQLEGKVFLKGHIHDISAHGMNASFYRVLPINVGEIAPSCVIEMPEGAPVRSKFEIKDVHISEDAGTLSLRGQFLNMNSMDEKRMRKFVDVLEKSLGSTQP